MSEYIHGPLGEALEYPIRPGDSVLVKNGREPRLPWKVYASDGHVATLERPGIRVRRLCAELEPARPIPSTEPEVTQ